MSRVLWIVFFIDLLVIALDAFSGLFNFNLPLLRFLVLCVSIILLFLHAIYTLGKARALFFIFLAAAIGFISEILALKTGVIFGGYYIYRASEFMIYGVPWQVVFFWAVFIYIGYCITTSFLYWLKKDKPNYKKKNFLLLILLILLDGLFVVAIDLFMDPLQVHAGSWRWLTGGPYYGIPIGNFVGWFFVAVAVTGIYRLFEYFNIDKSIEFDKKIFLVPVFGYGALYFSFAMSAINAQFFSLAVIGSFLMLPVVISNLFLFLRWKQ